MIFFVCYVLYLKCDSKFFRGRGQKILPGFLAARCSAPPTHPWVPAPPQRPYKNFCHTVKSSKKYEEIY